MDQNYLKKTVSRTDFFLWLFPKQYYIITIYTIYTVLGIMSNLGWFKVYRRLYTFSMKLHESTILYQAVEHSWIWYQESP
jgi:hypothetical protein